MKWPIFEIITEKALSDRVTLSSESTEEISHIFLVAVDMYAKLHGFILEECAIQVSPNNKIRVLEGQPVEAYFYNNTEDHGIYGDITYSKRSGNVEVKF